MPQDTNTLLKMKAAATAGEFFSALALKLESLRQHADRLLDSAGLELGRSGVGAPPASLAEWYEDASRAVSAKLDELGDESPVELDAVGYIYKTIGNVLGALSTVDSEHLEEISKVLLIGMDIGTVGSFCARVDLLDSEAETAALAEKLLMTKRLQSSGAAATNAARSSWRVGAFVTSAVFLHFNPGQIQQAKLRAEKFAREQGHELTSSAIDKAFRRYPEERARIGSIVADAIRSGIGSAPEEFRGLISSAVAAYGPSNKASNGQR